MEAVQQKVALSQQLEELEMDMHVMLQEQLREKLGLGSSQSEKPNGYDSDKSEVIPTPSSIFSFFLKS